VTKRLVKIHKYSLLTVTHNYYILKILKQNYILQFLLVHKWLTSHYLVLLNLVDQIVARHWDQDHHRQSRISSSLSGRQIEKLLCSCIWLPNLISIIKKCKLRCESWVKSIFRCDGLVNYVAFKERIKL